MAKRKKATATPTKAKNERLVVRRQFEVVNRPGVVLEGEYVCEPEPDAPTPAFANAVAKWAALNSQPAFAEYERAFLKEVAKPAPPPDTIAPKYPAAPSEPQAVETTKGVAPRNAKFLEWHEAEGSDTYHKPKRIQETWWAMTDEQRTAICPDNPARVSRVAVSRGISRARKLRGDPPKKQKIKRNRSRRKA